MGILWMDGFDHYGTVANQFATNPALDGVYAEMNGCSIVTANPRTGARHLRVGASNDGGPRRVFGSDLQEVGVGYAFHIPTLPTNSTSLCLAQFRTNGNGALLSIVVSSTGQLIAKRGSMSSGTVLTTTEPCILAKSYQHFECFAVLDEEEGGVEVRINGVTRLNIAGVNTNSGVGLAAQVIIGSPGTGITGFPLTFDVDDLYAWDTSSGGQNNDFIGDKKVYTRFPDGDASTGEWNPIIAGPGYQMIDNAPPLDATQYLYSSTAGDKSEFTVANLPAEVVSIAGVMTATRAWKSDAGNAKIQVAALSGLTEDAGAIHALSQAPTYYHDVFETDPNTGGLWTLEGFDAMQVSLERTE